jgi:hypothetical protein
MLDSLERFKNHVKNKRTQQVYFMLLMRQIYLARDIESPYETTGSDRNFVHAGRYPALYAKASPLPMLTNQSGIYSFW